MLVVSIELKRLLRFLICPYSSHLIHYNHTYSHFFFKTSSLEHFEAAQVSSLLAKIILNKANVLLDFKG